MSETNAYERITRRTTQRSRAFVVASAAAFGATLAACGGDSLPGGPQTYKDPVGSYDVATVNAQATPYKIFAADNYSYEVMSSTIVLTADGKFSLKETFRQTIAGKQDTFVDSTGGTWVLSGTTVSFVNGQDGSADKADWASSGSLTFVENEGTATNTYVYKIRGR